MVYSGAVDRIIGRPPPKTGEVVLVADGTEKPIGWGLYNSASMFCVRLMQLEEEAVRYLHIFVSMFCLLLVQWCRTHQGVYPLYVLVFCMVTFVEIYSFLYIAGILHVH